MVIVVATALVQPDGAWLLWLLQVWCNQKVPGYCGCFRFSAASQKVHGNCCCCRFSTARECMVIFVDTSLVQAQTVDICLLWLLRA